MIASLKVHGSYRLRVKAQIDSQDLQRDIVVVHFVVAKSNVDVDSMEVFVFDQQLLVNLSCFLIM